MNKNRPKEAWIPKEQIPVQIRHARFDHIEMAKRIQAEEKMRLAQSAPKPEYNIKPPPKPKMSDEELLLREYLK